MSIRLMIVSLAVFFIMYYWDSRELYLKDNIHRARIKHAFGASPFTLAHLDLTNALNPYSYLDIRGRTGA